MNTRLITIFVVVALVAAGVYLSRPDSGGENSVARLAGDVSTTPPGEQEAVDPDMSPPDFFIIRSGENAITLAELKGKPVFINFWYTGCTYCRNEMPDLNKLYREYGKTVEFIFINVLPMEKSIHDVTKFMSDNGYSMPVYLDRQGEVTRAYGVGGFPATVVLNNAGEVIYAAAGQISYDKAKSLITE